MQVSAHVLSRLTIVALVFTSSLPAQETSPDPFEAIKDIPLGENATLSLGGAARLRYEQWNNFGFASANVDGFLLSRMLIHADLKIGARLRVFGQGVSAFATKRDLPGGRRTLDVNELDLHQAYAEIALTDDEQSPLTLRLGRQELLFGRQRLVSPLPWANTMRTWDGATLRWRHGPVVITGFYTLFAPVRKYEFDEPEPDIDFYGLYSTFDLPWGKMKVDAYWLGMDRAMATFNGTAGREQRHTFGARLFGPMGESGMDVDVEAAGQVGEVGSADVRAWMLSAELGYRLSDTDGDPRLWLGFDYASGDDTPGGDVQTFNQLFPLGHAFFGYADVVGRQNVIAVSGGASIHPIKAMTVKLAGHAFWLAENSDALYNAGGSVVRGPAPRASDFVGIEIDLVVQYRIDQHWTVEAGYSHVFAGAFIDDTGLSDDIDLFYWQLVMSF